MPGVPRGKPAKFRPEARSEALEAFEWYDVRDPKVADRFDEQLREVTRKISRGPQLFPRYPGQPAAQFVRVPGFPYLIIYRELVDECEIIAVAHTRRRPLYWDTRLRGG